MTDQQHESDERIAEYHASEPSIPETHASLELTDDAVIIYDREDSRQWLWADEAVQRAAWR